MKPEVQNEIEMAHHRMIQLMTVMMFEFQNLCVKAEATSLLKVQVMAAGRMMNIEEVADVIVSDWNQFQLFVRDQRHMAALRTAILKVHPEFKQETEPAMVYEGQQMPEDSLLCTMPPVNKDRRDLLNTLTDNMYNKYCLKVDGLKARASARIAMALKDAPQDSDQANDALDSMYKGIKEKMEKSYQEKLEEIEKAYQRYIEEHPDEDEKNDGGKDKSQDGDDVAFSMPFESWKE